MGQRAPTHIPVLRRAAARPQAWLRVLLVSMLLSVLQGLSGWVIAAVTVAPGQVLVEVCTPAGLQWVAMDDALGGDAPAAPSEQPMAMGQPCVWAAAALSLPAAPLPQGLVAALAPARLHRVGWHHRPSTPDTVERVLLMAPMRAPPPPVA